MRKFIIANSRGFQFLLSTIANISCNNDELAEAGSMIASAMH